MIYRLDPLGLISALKGPPISAEVLKRPTKKERIALRIARREMFEALKPKLGYLWSPRQSGYAGPIVMQANR